MDFLKSYKNQKTNEKDLKIFEGICKSILLLVFRPDRMMTTVNQLLKDIFDDEFIAIPELNLLEVIKNETPCKTPILFCYSPGFDSSIKIESLARHLKKKFLSITIGSSEGFELIKNNWEKNLKSGE